MIKILPLITGVHDAVDSLEGKLLAGHTGAVTLLRHEHGNVLVDTGARGFFPDIVAALAECKLTPEDITHVILTHLHLDHAFNVGEFTNAKVLAWMHEWRSRETLRLEQPEGYQVLPGIMLIRTPGHAEEHLSVVAEDADMGTTVIAGDAIEESFVRTGTIKAFAYDRDLYRASAERILDIADTIIPGHGRIFRSS